MNDYRGLMRKKLLEDIYDRMSNEEKRLFVQLSIQDKDKEEILQAIGRQDGKIEDVSRRIGKYPFASDLLANVSGNFITDGLTWLGKALFRKL